MLTSRKYGYKKAEFIFDRGYFSKSNIKAMDRHGYSFVIMVKGMYRSGEDGLPVIILYKYTETRAKFNAVGFLGEFRGYLETDCCQGYDSLPGIIRCCCWAHLRRYFVEAVPKGKELDYSNPVDQGVQYCNKLFEYERQLREKGHTFDQRREYCLQKEKPVLDAFWAWVSSQAPNTVGRKTGCSVIPPKGAEASATVYTMVEMTKAHGLNIYKYLKYLLERLPGTKMTDSALSKLAPWDQDVIASCSGAM